MDRIPPEVRLTGLFGVSGLSCGLMWNMETWRKHLASTNRRGLAAVHVLRDRGDFERLMQATVRRGLIWGGVGLVLGALMKPVIFPLIRAASKDRQ